AYRSLARRVRGAGDEPLLHRHPGRAAPVEVDGLVGAQRVHDAGALLEARADAVAGAPAIHGDEEQVAAGLRSGQGARVAALAEAVVELRVLRVDEALCERRDLRLAALQQPWAAVDDARPRANPRALAKDALGELGLLPRLCVGAEPVGALPGAGEDRAVRRDGASASLAQRRDAARGVEDGLGSLARLGVRAEDGGEVDQLGWVRAGEVVFGFLCRVVPTLAAAAPDQARLAVLAVYDSRRPVGGPDGELVGEGRHVRASSISLGEDEAGPAVHGLADEVAFEDGDAGQIPRRAVVRADNEVAAVYGRQSARARRDARQELALRHDLCCQLRRERAVVAVGVDLQDVDHPRPRRLLSVLPRVDGARAFVAVGRELSPEGVGLCLRGELPDADQVARGTLGRVVRGAVGDPLDAGPVAVGPEPVGDLLGRGPVLPEGHVDGVEVHPGLPAALDAGVGDARRHPFGGPTLLQAGIAERQFAAGGARVRGGGDGRRQSQSTQDQGDQDAEQALMELHLFPSPRPTARRSLL
ncbi:MAG: hypothetical protein AVDCRST_MAG01-01-2304, partial [uncultured Rubrobacteraceae bacterium]